MPLFGLELSSSTLGVVAVSILLQVALRGLSRLLGVKLSIAELAGGPLLALVILSPRFLGNEVMVPTPPLRVIPGVTASGPGPHDLLSDAVYQFLPWEHEVRRLALEERVFPFWSGRLDGGSSPWSNPQAQVHSVLAWMARLFPLGTFLLASLFFKIQTAFTGALLLGRAIGLRRRVLPLFGASFAVGGSMLAWALFPHSSALAWTPWACAAYIFCIRSSQLKVFLGSVLCTVLLLLAGHPEISGLAALSAVALGLSCARRTRPRVGPTLRLIEAAVIGLLLTAPATVPFLEAALKSDRAAEVNERPARSWTSTPAGPPVFLFDPGSIAFLKSPLSSEVFGRPYWEEFRGPVNWVDACSGYFGVVGLGGLALLGMRTQRTLISVVLFGSVFSMLCASRFLPALFLLDEIPLLRLVAVGRFLPMAALGFLCLGFIGWSRVFASHQVTFRHWLVMGMVAASSAAFGLNHRTLIPWLAIGGAMLTAGRSRRSASALLLFAVMWDLGNYSRGFLPRGDESQFFPRTEVTQWLQSKQLDGVFRVGGVGATFFPSTLSVYGLADFRSHNPLADAAYVDLLGSCCGIQPSEFNYLATAKFINEAEVNKLGVRYLVARAGELAPAGWPQVFRAADGSSVFENPALPQVFALDWLGPTEARFRISERAFGYQFDIDSREGARLSSTIPTPEGWEIRSSRGLIRASPSASRMLAFEIPAGESQVELRFTPPGFRTGIITAILGILLLALRGTRHKIGMRSRS